MEAAKGEMDDVVPGLDTWTLPSAGSWPRISVEILPVPSWGHVAGKTCMFTGADGGMKAL